MKLKLKSLNGKLDERYGFPTELVYETHGEIPFNGHIIGIFVGTLSEYLNIERNAIHSKLDNRDELLRNIVADEEVFLLQDDYINMVGSESPDFNENLDAPLQFVRYTNYYVPYFVENHSAWKPTCNFDNFGSNDNEYRVELEWLFVHGDFGCNRYFNLIYNITNEESMYEIALNAIDKDFKEKFLLTEDQIPEDEDILNVDDIKSNVGFYVDFYTLIGERKWIWFKDIQTFKNTLISFRPVDFTELELIKEDKDND